MAILALTTASTIDYTPRQNHVRHMPKIHAKMGYGQLEKSAKIEIGCLIATVVLILITLVATFAGGLDNALILIVMGMVALGIATLVAQIFKLVGCINVSKDIPECKKALLFIIFGMILSIPSMFDENIIGIICGIANQVFQILSVYFIIAGTNGTLKSMDRYAHAQQGDKIWGFMAIAAVLLGIYYVTAIIQIPIGILSTIANIILIYARVKLISYYGVVQMDM